MLYLPESIYICTNVTEKEKNYEFNLISYCCQNVYMYISKWDIFEDFEKYIAL